MVDGSGLILRT